jgi:cytochrome c oxidase assembly factor CtaG
MLGSAVIGAWRLKQQGEDAAMSLERRFTLWISVAFVACFVAAVLFYLLNP